MEELFPCFESVFVVFLSKSIFIGELISAHPETLMRGAAELEMVPAMEIRRIEPVGTLKSPSTVMGPEIVVSCPGGIVKVPLKKRTPVASLQTQPGIFDGGGAHFADTGAAAIGG